MDVIYIVISIRNEVDKIKCVKLCKESPFNVYGKGGSSGFICNAVDLGFGIEYNGKKNHGARFNEIALRINGKMEI